MNKNTKRDCAIAYSVAAGCCDTMTGILLMSFPEMTLKLMMIGDVPAQPIYLRFVGAFVFGVGVAYLYPFVSGVFAAANASEELEPGRKWSANSFRLATRSPSSLTSERELQRCGGRACREPVFSSDVELHPQKGVLLPGAERSCATFPMYVKLTVIWEVTALIRAVVAAFVLTSVACTVLSPQWLSVAACDAGFAIAQITMLRRGFLTSDGPPVANLQSKVS